jgi:hypothetical protein
MRKPKIYPIHPCARCQGLTTGKTYCPPCLKIIKQPKISISKTRNDITANKVNSDIFGRRRKGDTNKI